MGYRIKYKPVRKIRNRQIARSWKLTLIGFFFLLFLGVTYAFWPAGMQILRDLLTAAIRAVYPLLHALQDMVEPLFSAVLYS